MSGERRQSSFAIEIESDIIIARAEAARAAERAGFSRRQCNEIAIAVSELGTNIVKYARPGRLAFRMIDGPPESFEIVAEDRGRGIADVEMAMREFCTDRGSIISEDGYLRPPGEGLGCGLSAVRRLMDSLTIVSAPGRGTSIRTTKLLGRKKTAR